MSGDEARHVLERFVAGLPVEADELAHAITARAVERSVVVQAIVSGLADPRALVRLRVARRVRRMPELDTVIGAQLRILAVGDEDPRVREASAQALRVHSLDVPGDPPAPEVAGAQARHPRAGLLLRLVVAGAARGTMSGVRVVPRWRGDAKGASGRCVVDAAGVAVLQLQSLPQGWVGSLPQLRAAGPLGEPVVLGVAIAPVAGDGSVAIVIHEPLAGPGDDPAGLLPANLELVAAAD